MSASTQSASIPADLDSIAELLRAILALQQAQASRSTLEPLNLKDSEAAHLLGISRTTFRRLVADGTIPPPVKLNGCSLWPTSWIRNFVAEFKPRRRARS